MKGKSLFFLGAIVAAGLLVGGTFAAWAVTDNANPFSVTITPETLEVGDNKSVTLDWGTRGLINIESLSIGEEKGPYALGLRATTSDNSAFVGNLSVAMATEAAGEQKLINYLHVNVYESDAIPHGEALLTVPDGSANYSVNKDIQVTSGEEKVVYFFISLDSGISPATYTAIKNDVVTLTVDWNKGSEIEEITAATVYYKNVSNWENVYAYAWKAADLSSNAEWPGVKMANAKDDIFTAAIGVGFDKIIFNNGNGGTGNQTDDLDLDIATPYYNGTAWGAAPDLAAEVEYYLVGTFNNWMMGEAYKLTKLETAHNSFNYHIEHVCLGNEEFKIVSSDNVWFGERGNVGETPNVTLGLADTYDIYFNPTLVGDVYLQCVQQNPVTPEP